MRTYYLLRKFIPVSDHDMLLELLLYVPGGTFFCVTNRRFNEAMADSEQYQLTKGSAQFPGYVLIRRVTPASSVSF